VTSVPLLSQRARRGVPWLLLLATVAAAAAGWAIATALYPRESAAPARPTAILRAGVARLALPPEWEPLRRPAIPGLRHAPSARGAHSDIAMDVRTPDDPSLLPGPMLLAVGEPPQPQLHRSGGRVAWSYDLRGLRGRRRITALAMPTTAGVVTVACVADETLAPYVSFECEEALAALELRGAAPLRPAPETAAQIVAGPTIARLNDVRSAARRGLSSTRSPVRRARAVRRIAAAYAAAGRRLEPLARGAAAPLPRTLAALARAHRSLAAASAKRDALSAARAGRAIDRRERRLASQLQAASR
jgi:hypothetical protein